MSIGEYDSILEAYPRSGYFRDYLNMVQNLEICPRFHFFVAAATLGTILNRKVSFQRGSRVTFPTLYPNPWIMLVAPQGSGHKSSALRIGRYLLEDLPEEFRPKIMRSKLTPEVLVKSLASEKPPITITLPPGISSEIFKDNAIGLIYSSEFGTFLGREKYNAGLVPLLTDLYDCPREWSSETIMRGSHILYNVCLSLMVASTPDWMQSMLPADAFRGGFMSRQLIITLPIHWDKVVPDPEAPPEGIRDKILDQMIKFSQLQGEFRWSYHGKQRYENWYISMKREQKILSGPLAAYRERKQDHLLRIAMLLQVTDTYDEFELSEETIERALQILSVIEKETSAAIEFIATEPKMRPAQLILETVRKYRRISEANLLRIIWRNLPSPRDFNEIIVMLLKAKEIKLNITKEDAEYEYTGK